MEKANIVVGNIDIQSNPKVETVSLEMVEDYQLMVLEVDAQMADVRVAIAKDLTIQKHKQMKELGEQFKAVITNNLRKKYLAVRASFPESFEN